MHLTLATGPGECGRRDSRHDAGRRYEALRENAKALDSASVLIYGMTAMKTHGCPKSVSAHTPFS